MQVEVAPPAWEEHGHPNEKSAIHFDHDCFKERKAFGFAERTEVCQLTVLKRSLFERFEQHTP